MSNVSQWSSTDASNTSAPPAGAPEGWAPSTVNAVVRAMMGALARDYLDLNGTLLSTGTGTAYALTTNNVHAALADQSMLVFRVHVANTAACTLNVDSLGAKTIRAGGTAILVGALPLDEIVCLVYNADADAYDLIGGFISGIADGGTGATTAAGALTAIGGAELDAIAALAVTDGNFIVGNGSTWIVEDTATARASLGVSDEFIEDIVGAMLTGNTETGILVTYQDGDGTIDFVIDLDTLSDMGVEALLGTDYMIVVNGTTSQKISIDDMTLPIAASDAGAHTFLATEANHIKTYTGTGGHNWALNTSILLPGQAISIPNDGSGDGPTITGSATVESATGFLTVKENGVGTLICFATNKCKMIGDLVA